MTDTPSVSSGRMAAVMSRKIRLLVIGPRSRRACAHRVQSLGRSASGTFGGPHSRGDSRLFPSRGPMRMRKVNASSKFTCARRHVLAHFFSPRSRDLVAISSIAGERCLLQTCVVICSAFERQRLAHFARVELAQRPRCRIARIGEHRLARGHALLELEQAEMRRPTETAGEVQCTDDTAPRSPADPHAPHARNPARPRRPSGVSLSRATSSARSAAFQRTASRSANWRGT
jgi:hypothetical protein